MHASTIAYNPNALIQYLANGLWWNGQIMFKGREIVSKNMRLMLYFYGKGIPFNELQYIFNEF